jgi:membrane fusion protein (multidrug efflux system)
MAVTLSLSAAAKAPKADDELDCMLEPNTKIDISPSVAGVLSDVLVERGDRVKRGQLLAKLVSGPEQAAVQLAQARLEFAERKAARNEDLFKKELISVNEKDEMDTEVSISRAQLKQAQEQLELRQIISPIDGVVVESDKDPGEYVETNPVMTLVSLNPLNVEVVAPAERFGTIKKGMHGKVTIYGPKNGTYDAKVVLIDQIIDAASGTIRVRLALANPKNAIPAGLKCSVKFITK